LEEKGFEVAVETIKKASEKIEKGNVIKTDPQSGRTIKKGSTVTLYESLGKETYTIEDYTGSNYIEIQTLLERVYELKVEIKKKDIDMTEDYGEQDIIDQSIKADTVVAKGDSIILYIPNIVDTYPDMVDEGWTAEEVQTFCDKFGVTLKIDYKETNEYQEGTLISQSRSPKTPIVEGSTLKIVVAKRVEPSTSGGESSSTEENPTPEGEDEQ
jgi:serine/threonine-protein kinase